MKDPHYALLGTAWHCALTSFIVGYLFANALLMTVMGIVWLSN
ncbi:MAG: hypothetical protein AAF387_09570 [Pseudomonadota bacterium]